MKFRKPGDRALVVAGLALGLRRFVRPRLLVRGRGRRCGGSPRGGRCGRDRRAGLGKRGCRGLRGRLLEPLHARVEVHVHVPLALRGHLDVVAHDLDLAAQLCHLLAQPLDLLRELERGIGCRQPLERFVHARKSRREVFVLALQLIETLRLLRDLLARDIIAAKQLRGDRRRQTEARHNSDAGKTEKKTGRS